VTDTNIAVKVEEVSPVMTKLLFDVSWDDVKKEMDAVYRDVGRTAKVKGFRKGKIPRNILEMHYKDYVEGETIANLIERLYLDALKNYNIYAANRPDIDQNGIEHDKNFTFTATVEVEPVIKPTGYSGLELEKVEQEVTENEVDARLEEYRQMFATMEDIKEERGVREGDFATLDFSGSIDGVARKELEAGNFLLEVGTKRFIPGFEEQLIGIAHGETKEIHVRFPDDYYVKDIAGKDAIFTLTVKSIKEKKLPLLDPSFIENFQKYQSLEELKADIRKTLDEQYKVKSGNDLRNLIVNELLKNNEIEVPPSYVEREYQYIMSDAQRRMASDGLTDDEASDFCKKFQDQYRQTAERAVRITSLLKSIAGKESIVVEDGDVEKRIKEIAQQSRDHENARKYLDNESVRANIRQEILSNKVFKFIEDNSHITFVKKKAGALAEVDK
jgi:trigger factor